MKIRTKLLAVILPLTIVSMVSIGAGAALSARAGITRLAVEFLAFKAEQLESYADEQWSLLVNNDLTDREDLLAVTRQSVAGRALEMIRSEGELMLALEGGRRIAFATRPLEVEHLLIDEWNTLRELSADRYRGWIEMTIRGEPRVGYAFYFEPFDWTVLVTESSATFYAAVSEIIRRSIGITLVVILAASIALVVLSRVLTRPLGAMVTTIESIIEKGDLTTRVAVLYDDEVGRLSHTFNTMMHQLDGSYQQIKEYALNAAMAKRDEQKIRSIFQKYGPQHRSPRPSTGSTRNRRKPADRSFRRASGSTTAR